MKVLFMTGSHPRHLYIAKKLYEAGMLAALLIESREQFLPEAPHDLSEDDRSNFIRHFNDRHQSEQQAFSIVSPDYFSQIPVLRISLEELNGEKVKKWIQSMQVSVAISYGVHKLNNHILELLPEHAWNIHGGLSPWYKGNTTLFWPFYFLKPNWAGMTIHRLTARLDGGDIVHHSVPSLERGNGIHDVACNAVKQVAEDLIIILNKLLNNEETIQYHSQKSSGKLFTSLDWNPQHLRLIYNQFNNDIVDRFLDGELGYHEPPLIKAF